MTTPIFITGSWQEGKEAIELYEPGTHQFLDRIGWASADQALAAAHGLAEAFPATRRLPAHRIAKILKSLAVSIERDAETLSRTISKEAGKPIRLAATEVERAILTTQWAAEEALRRHGEMWRLDIMPSVENTWGVHFRVPRGSVLAITPFNFPLNLILHKIAPAIAVGAPFIIKPSPQTPLTALHVTRLILESGWPENAIAFIPCSNETTKHLVESSDIAVVSYTGSTRVGWNLKTLAGKKTVILELGGNAGVIVHEDADPIHTAERCAFGAYAYSGQVCISVQRIYVHKNIWDDFTKAFIDAAQNLKVGPVHDPEVIIGPMIHSREVSRIHQWIQQAIHAGAHPLLEGRTEGDWIHPWALTHVPWEQPVSCEEIFGPVAVIEPYDDFSEAIRFVNNSNYGLQAGLFTHRWDLIQQAMEEVDVGGLIVNDIPTLRIDPMPYGGMKDSGLGREGLRFAMESMTDIRMVVFRK